MTGLIKKFFPLFLVSFLTLFLELLVIRLVGTEIRIFAYLSNFTLLAIFAGSGLSTLFKNTPDRSGAFAYNLLGSAVGGFFEVLSFLFGIQALMIVSAMFYFLAFLTNRNHG